MQVNDLQSTDRLTWEKLYRAYADFYKVPMNQDILDAVWTWIFDEAEAFYALIVKDDQGQAVGFMHFREMVSPLRAKKVGFLDDLYVMPEARGKGAVELLFERLQLEAKGQGWPFVRWITADDNFRARAVYDKCAKRTMWLTYQMDLT